MSTDSRIQMMRVPTVEDWLNVRREAAQRMQFARKWGTGDRDAEIKRYKAQIVNATAQIARLDPNHPSLKR